MIGRAIMAVAFMLGLGVLATVPTPVAALDIKCQSSNAGQCDLVKSNQNLENQVWRILQVVFGILGGVAVIMIIFGGFMYTTSTGDSGKVKNAKNTIIYAVVGLVVAVLATAIVSFVLASIS